MSTQELNQLTPILRALPAAEVRALSGMPIATFLAEAQTLSLLVARAEITERLKEVGATDERLTIFPIAVLAARQAQALWTQMRGRRNSEAFKDAISRGEALRSRALKACRWNLRHNDEVQTTLKFIRQGDSIADLAQDLHNLAGLLENYTTAFDSDQTFNAPSIAAQARNIATTLMDKKADFYHGISQSGAKDLRDRAFSFLRDLVSELREAGDYAFSDDPSMAKRFTSRYWRHYNHSAALPKLSPDEPIIPVGLTMLEELQATDALIHQTTPN